jgi:hypothetical protein
MDTLNIEILEHDDRDAQGIEHARYYIFQDVAELFWPGEYDHDNHGATSKVKQALRDRGCGVTKRDGEVWWITPVGEVAFDSESGCFECHAPAREPVEYVRNLIIGIKGQLDDHRNALR